MNNYYLALDVSSTTIGICGFAIKDKKMNFESFFADYIKPPKDGNEIENLHKLNIQINEFIDNRDNFKGYDKVIVAIEEFPFFMQGGKTTAQTIAKLAIYNRITSLFVYEKLNIEPIFYHVATVRSVIKKLVGRKDKIVKKEIPELLCEIFTKINDKEWVFPYRKTKKGSISEESYDISDAIAVACTCAYKHGDLIIK
jgi:Holliday junction resolvasome RuvABC endonuclease subunit